MSFVSALRTQEATSSPSPSNDREHRNHVHGKAMSKAHTLPRDTVASMTQGASPVSDYRNANSYVDAVGEGPRSESEPRQTSFEVYSAQQDPPYVRDVSEGEDIAAFALLACRNSVSRSSSGSSGEGAAEGAGGGDGGAGGGAGRVDSGSWMNLLRSGGEPTSLSGSLFPRSSSGSSAASGTASSGAGAGGFGRGSVLSAMDNDPGPMPEHAPFGFGSYSGTGGNHAPQRHASRSQTARRLLASSFGRSYGSGIHDRGGSGGNGGGGGGGIGPGRVAGSSGWMPVPCMPGMAGAGSPGTGGIDRCCQGPPHRFRQCSFDPHKPVLGLPLQSNSWDGSYHPLPAAGPSLARVSPAMPLDNQSYFVSFGTTSFTGGTRPAAYEGVRPSRQPLAVGGRFIDEASCVREEGGGGGIEVMAPTTHPPHARTVAPVRTTPPVQGAEAAPRNRLFGGSTVTRLTERNDTRNNGVEEDESSHGRKPSFDHLKSLIPGFEALTGGSGGGARHAGNSNCGIGGDGGNGRSSFPEGKMEPRATTPLEGRMDPPLADGGVGLLKRPFSAIDGSACHNKKPISVSGLTLGQEHIVTPRQAALERYRRKKGRRKFVKAAREQDPARAIQNKSRERPRQQGKFIKAKPDFLSITSIQPHSVNNRAVSAEVPTFPVTRAPPAAAGGGGDDGPRAVLSRSMGNGRESSEHKMVVNAGGREEGDR